MSPPSRPMTAMPGWTMSAAGTTAAMRRPVMPCRLPACRPRPLRAGPRAGPASRPCSCRHGAQAWARGPAHCRGRCRARRRANCWTRCRTRRPIRGRAHRQGSDRAHNAAAASTAARPRSSQRPSTWAERTALTRRWPATVACRRASVSPRQGGPGSQRAWARRAQPGKAGARSVQPCSSAWACQPVSAMSHW